jgi:hypothetical protein
MAAVRNGNFSLDEVLNQDILNKLPHPCSPTFLGKIVARNKNLLQGIIGFGRAILPDTPPPN